MEFTVKKVDIYAWSTEDIDSIIETHELKVDPEDMESIITECEDELNNWDTLNGMIYECIYDVITRYAKEDEDE